MNIIQRSSLPIYQQLFTLLLQTYRAKYLLQRATLPTIQLLSPHLRQLGYKLRQRLIWFADMVRSYLTETVIAPSFAAMAAALGSAADIDEMADIHMKYVARVQDQALLSEKLRPIHKAVVALLDLATAFAKECAHAPLPKSSTAKAKAKAKSRDETTRRRSVIPDTADEDSDSSNAGVDDDDDDDAMPKPHPQPQTAGLAHTAAEFERLLPFVTAGLRSVGRVGAEPVWEMLAERLAWGGIDV